MEKVILFLAKLKDLKLNNCSFYVFVFMLAFSISSQTNAQSEIKQRHIKQCSRVLGKIIYIIDSNTYKKVAQVTFKKKFLITGVTVKGTGIFEKAKVRKLGCWIKSNKFYLFSKNNKRFSLEMKPTKYSSIFLCRLNKTKYLATLNINNEKEALNLVKKTLENEQKENMEAKIKIENKLNIVNKKIRKIFIKSYPQYSRYADYTIDATDYKLKLFQLWGYKIWEKNDFRVRINNAVGGEVLELSNMISIDGKNWSPYKTIRFLMLMNKSKKQISIKAVADDNEATKDKMSTFISFNIVAKAIVITKDNVNEVDIDY